MKFSVNLTQKAEVQVGMVENPVSQTEIARAIEALALFPFAGKPLNYELKGFRSIRADRSQYRVVYSVDTAKCAVTVVRVGIRKYGMPNDVYEELKRELAGNGDGR